MYLCSILGYFPQRKILNKFICSKHLNCQFSVQWICWNKLHYSFFESPWSEQDSCAPIFSMYMTQAQKTREDVKYFKDKLYIFFFNYLEYHLASWGSNLSNLLVNTFIYHQYFNLGQNIQECTKIDLVHSWILCPIYPCHRDMEEGEMIQQRVFSGEMILQRVFVAGRQNFKLKHSPGITLNKFVWLSRLKNAERKFKFGKYMFFILIL